MRAHPLITASLIIVLTVFPEARGFDFETHRTLSERAARHSNLDVFLSSIGLDEELSTSLLGFTIEELISAGTVAEDSPVDRVRHHFHNPLLTWDAAGLRVEGFRIGQSSVLWQQERNQDRGGRHSWHDGRESYYQALTVQTKAERERQFAETFQTVGHLIHLIQDAASPAHTRNDAHLSYNNIGDVDGFHAWADQPENLARVTGALTYDPAILKITANPLAPLPIARIIDTERYRQSGVPSAGVDIGMAEYSNANFLSDDTTFRGFPFPATTSVELGPPETLPDGRQRQYFRKVRDGEVVAHLATPGALYRYLPEALKPFAVNLDERVFQDYGDLLLPRAVGYSAGLIDYFFRGKLEAEDVTFTDTGISLRVKNAIDLQKTPAWQNEVLYAKNSNGSAGSFTVAFDYRDNAGKTQYGVSNTVPVRATDTLAPGQVSADVYDFTLTVPSEAKDVNYRLIFQGKLGQEEGAVAVGPVEPISGFIFSPNYFPADGISGPRVIFRQGGSWRLSQEAGLQAGNIDWKGWYVNGKSTKVLTWKGPPSRSFANHYVPARNLFSAAIYQDGELWAQAPGDVLGAAITRDANGKEWLVAVCRDNYSDVVYRRPNVQDISPALFDPVNAPVGWQEVAQFAHDPVILDRADVPWFFNGSGTEAQTIRKGSKDQGPSVGTVSWLYRLHLVLANGAQSAQLTRDDNLPGITDSDAATLVCNSAGKFLTRTSETTGQFILAVDYLDNTPLYAIFSVKRSRLTTDSQDAAGNHGKSEFSTEEKVTFPDGKDLVLYSNTTTSSTTAFDHSKIDRQLLYLDLRHGFYAEYTKTIEEHGVGDFTIPTTLATQASQSVVFLNDSWKINENTPTTVVSVFRYFPSGFTHPDVECNNSVSSKNISTRFQGAPFLNLKGSWAVDSNQKLFFSEPKLGNDPSTHSGYYNFLSDGNLKQLIPSAPFDAFYYDIGVIH